MLNLLFPKECLVCSKVGDWLCPRCKKKLVQTLPQCYICKTISNQYNTHNSCLKDSSFKKITTLWKYNECSKKLIHNYKYKHRFKIGDYIFSLFEDKLKDIDFKDSVLIPLPSHKMKEWERGFNPIENISNLISEKLNIPINTELVKKIQSNESQARLSYEQREENVKNIFFVNKKEVKNISKYKQLVVVDDIITTGATLNEVIFVLRKHISSNVDIHGLCIFQGSFKKK